MCKGEKSCDCGCKDQYNLDLGIPLTFGDGGYISKKIVQDLDQRLIKQFPDPKARQAIRDQAMGVIRQMAYGGLTNKESGSQALDYNPDSSVSNNFYDQGLSTNQVDSSILEGTRKEKIKDFARTGAQATIGTLTGAVDAAGSMAGIDTEPLTGKLSNLKFGEMTQSDLEKQQRANQIGQTVGATTATVLGGIATGGNSVIMSRGADQTFEELGQVDPNSPTLNTISGAGQAGSQLYGTLAGPGTTGGFSPEQLEGGTKYLNSKETQDLSKYLQATQGLSTATSLAKGGPTDPPKNEETKPDGINPNLMPQQFLPVGQSGNILNSVSMLPEAFIMSHSKGEGLSNFTPRTDNRKNFLEDVYAAARVFAQTHPGIHPEVYAVMAANESRIGRSGLTKKQNNYFGIRNFGGKTTPKQYQSDDTWVTDEIIDGERVADTEAKFENHGSFEGSLSAFYDFLKRNKRYASVFNASTPEEQLKLLKESGYRTGSFKHELKDLEKYFYKDRSKEEFANGGPTDPPTNPLRPSDFDYTTDRSRGNARYFSDPRTGEPFPLVNLPEVEIVETPNRDENGNIIFSGPEARDNYYAYKNLGEQGLKDMQAMKSGIRQKTGEFANNFLLPPTMAAATVLGGPPLVGLGSKAIPLLNAPLTVGSRTLPYITPSTVIGTGFGVKGAYNLGSDINTGFYTNPNIPTSQKVEKGITTGLDLVGTPGMGNALLQTGRNAYTVGRQGLNAAQRAGFLTFNDPLSASASSGSGYLNSTLPGVTPENLAAARQFISRIPQQVRGVYEPLLTGEGRILQEAAELAKGQPASTQVLLNTPTGITFSDGIPGGFTADQAVAFLDAIKGRGFAASGIQGTRSVKGNVNLAQDLAGFEAGKLAKINSDIAKNTKLVDDLRFSPNISSFNPNVSGDLDNLRRIHEIIAQNPLMPQTQKENLIQGAQRLAERLGASPEEIQGLLKIYEGNIPLNTGNVNFNRVERAIRFPEIGNKIFPAEMFSSDWLYGPSQRLYIDPKSGKLLLQGSMPNTANFGEDLTQAFSKGYTPPNFPADASRDYELIPSLFRRSGMTSDDVAKEMSNTVSSNLEAVARYSDPITGIAPNLTTTYSLSGQSYPLSVRLIGSPLLQKQVARSTFGNRPISVQQVGEKPLNTYSTYRQIYGAPVGLQMDMLESNAAIDRVKPFMQSNYGLNPDYSKIISTGYNPQVMAPQFRFTVGPTIQKAYGGGLRRWFKEDWTDVKTGEPCGRESASDSSRPYPYCRPANKVSSETPATIKHPEAKRRAKAKTGPNKVTPIKRR